MIEPIPIYGETAYAILYNRFGSQQFSPDHFKWFLSESMKKKIFHVLEKKGWIKRIGRAIYVCNKPEDIIAGMVAFKVPQLLEATGRKYCYTKMSAVEIWTNFSYIQRSWEHSPYFIRVLENDKAFWVNYFRAYHVPVFIGNPKTSLGEFVVLIVQKSFPCDYFDGKPVDSVKETAKFCTENIDTFEYPLAYLIKKFNLNIGVSNIVDKRVLDEVKA